MVPILRFFNKKQLLEFIYVLNPIRNYNLVSSWKMQKGNFLWSVQTLKYILFYIKESLNKILFCSMGTQGLIEKFIISHIFMLAWLKYWGIYATTFICLTISEYCVFIDINPHMAPIVWSTIRDFIKKYSFQLCFQLIFH